MMLLAADQQVNEKVVLINPEQTAPGFLVLSNSRLCQYARPPIASLDFMGGAPRQATANGASQFSARKNSGEINDVTYLAWLTGNTMLPCGKKLVVSRI
jgi:hypothetical protein